MDTTQLEKRITELENQMRSHAHKGYDTQRIDFFDVFGLFDTVSAVPTGIPNTPKDQIKIYKNSTTYRLYWYDFVNAQWRYATGT